MDFSLIAQNQLTPCVILGVVFGAAGHYFETKPQVIIFGILALFVVYYLSGTPVDKIVQSDLSNLREENESLKRNLMQVYSMVQQQKQQTVNSGPPPPIPPSMTGVGSPEEKVEEDEAKPYL